ncbi:hypothetical protein HK100_001531 [Physocladia obscura]|uniref:Uncharacterized protein n=1 Tax=Physocladia obscura TaxID=109957 RepID=A0AAD5SZA4_9FUNG|nr:hypothetical protein HK100_001531 [Physocladia obscura]
MRTNLQKLLELWKTPYEEIKVDTEGCTITCNEETAKVLAECDDPGSDESAFYSIVTGTAGHLNAIRAYGMTMEPTLLAKMVAGKFTDREATYAHFEAITTK